MQIQQEDAVVPAVGEIGIVVGSRRCGRKVIVIKNHEVVVDHPDTWYAGLSQRPGCIKACLAAEDQVLLRIGIFFTHVAKGNLGHAAEDHSFTLVELVPAHGTAKRIKDALRAVMNDRGVEEIGVADSLAVEEKILGRAQKTVFPCQVTQVAGAVEEFGWRYSLGNIQGETAVRRRDQAWLAVHGFSR